MGQLQTRVAQIRTRVQQQTASVRSRFGRGGMQIGWKDGNPASPVGLGGAIGTAAGLEELQILGGGSIRSKVQGLRKRFLPGTGTEDFQEEGPMFQQLPIVSQIRQKGFVGAITSRGMMQTITAGGFRPLPTGKPPSPQIPPATGPAGYRRFV